MDTFEALVRLDAAGWKTLPARPELGDGLPHALARLLKRAGGIEADGVRIDFASEAEPPAWLAPDVPFRRALGGGYVLLAPGEALWVLRITESPRTVDVLGRTLGDALQVLLEGPDLGGASPETLEAIGLEGDGWGWALEGLELPCTLDVEALPDGTLDGDLHFDAGHAWVGERIAYTRAPPTAPPAPEARSGPTDTGVDELFGEGSGRPRPRSALIGTLLAVGLFLTVVGMACINAPGGLIVLFAWLLVEKDLERLESGYLPEVDRAEVERMRAVTYAGLQLVVVLFFLQALLLCMGAYDVLLEQVYLPWWQSFIRGLLENPDALPPPP
ncbi:MAG: hypothetical protein H6736_14190 [Alphaproteobacteria bacterium]|nr:hypothetical protein [Alphaproteobacteria bacterium]MCB9692956.1 hypothetical protein [Alphaproteobacteria bacterium]